MPPTPLLFCSHVVEWGGAETVLADLLAGLDRERFAPHLACPGDGPLPARARQLAVPVHHLPIGGGSALAKAASIPRAAASLRALARSTGARLLYANTMIAGYAAVLAQRPDLPCLWHLHIVTTARVARLALRRAAAVVTPSRAGAAAVGPELAASSRLQVVPNGVAERFFTARGQGLRASLGLPEPTPLVGIVGRLDPDKGHEVLLRAFAELTPVPREGPAPHLVVVGSEAFAGALARVRGFGERLAALARDLRIAERVHFVGHRDDVAEVGSQLDVVAVPSQALESAPRAVAEAQAAGRAVVGSAIGGIPELITDGHDGLLVPPGDVGSLARALQQLLGDPELRRRLGGAGRLRAERQYGLPAFVRRIEAACERALAGSRLQGD